MNSIIRARSLSTSNSNRPVHSVTFYSRKPLFFSLPDTPVAELHVRHEVITTTRPRLRTNKPRTEKQKLVITSFE